MIILNEGGNAAEWLIPRLEAAGAPEGLVYSKIPQKQIGAVFNEVLKPMLASLSKAGIIDPKYKTEFSLGSTRLAAHIAGEKIKLLPSETPDVLAKAISSKQSFGDLDVDVVLKDGKTLNDVGDHLVSADPARFQYKLGRGEINVAVVWEGNRVIQIDIVNVGGDNKNEIEFEQSSSFVDLAQGVKGLFQSLFIRIVLTSQDISKKQAQAVRKAISTHPEIAKWLEQGYDFKIPGKEAGTKVGRFLLGKGGISIVVDLFKPGRKEGGITRKKIKINDQPEVGFSDLDKLADKIIPGANHDTINSVLKMAQYVRRKSSDKIPQIWESFKDAVSHNISGMSKPDLDTGMNTIADILGTEWTGFGEGE